MPVSNTPLHSDNTHERMELFDAVAGLPVGHWRPGEAGPVLREMHRRWLVSPAPTAVSNGGGARVPWSNGLWLLTPRGWLHAVSPSAVRLLPKSKLVRWRYRATSDVSDAGGDGLSAVATSRRAAEPRPIFAALPAAGARAPSTMPIAQLQEGRSVVMRSLHVVGGNAWIEASVPGAMAGGATTTGFVQVGDGATRVWLCPEAAAWPTFAVEWYDPTGDAAIAPPQRFALGRGTGLTPVCEPVTAAPSPAAATTAPHQAPPVAAAATAATAGHLDPTGRAGDSSGAFDSHEDSTTLRRSASLRKAKSRSFSAELPEDSPVVFFAVYVSPSDTLSAAHSTGGRGRPGAAASATTASATGATSQPPPLGAAATAKDGPKVATVVVYGREYLFCRDGLQIQPYVEARFEALGGAAAKPNFADTKTPTASQDAFAGLVPLHSERKGETRLTWKEVNKLVRDEIRPHFGRSSYRASGRNSAVFAEHFMELLLGAPPKGSGPRVPGWVRGA